MQNFENNCINSKKTILEGIQQLTKLNSNILTLFVCDESKKLVGTITDGNMRRGFVSGYTLENPVSDFMNTNFKYITDKEFDVEKINAIRKDDVQLLPVIDDKGRIVRVYNLKRLKSILPVECVIMAGGVGRRLKPLTDNTPKPLIKLGPKPIIEHNIDRLISYGIEKIYISIRYLGQQIIDYLGDGSSKGIKIEYITEDKPLGTAGAMSLVDDFKSSYILLMNSDLFTDIDFEDLFLATIREGASMGIASIPYTVNIPYAIFEREGAEVISFKEKPNNTHYANAGIYCLKKNLVEKIPKNEFFDITDLIQIVLDSNEKIIQNPILGYWIDVGKHEDLAKAREICKHIY